MSDEFDTDKGVKDDYDGVITDAYFQAGETGDTNLVLKKIADDGEEVEDFYRVGADWASFDGGETIEHPSKSKIRADSQLAVLVERAMAAGAADVIHQRSADNDKKGQKTAKLWPGLSFHWTVDAKPYDFKDRKTGESVTGVSYKSYPDRFIGVVENGAEGTASGASGAAAAGGTASGGVAEAPQMPPEVGAKLKVLAQSKPFAEWVDEALTMDWVRENLLSALSDEGFYNNLRTGG